MPTEGHERRHVPALDGVRGLAVAAVLLYHLESSPLPGGFLGVSSFFTLSGFLITTLVVQERERSGTIDLWAFWGRRWRRLLPALLVCLTLVVVGAAAGAYAPAQVDAVSAEVPWAIGYAANWHQILHGGGYLQDLAAPSPLEHLWSLGIEEQFYVGFPLLVAGVLAVAARRQRAGRPTLVVVMGAGAVVSIGLAVLLDWSPERVYLGTDTRIVEVLVGAVLAVVVRGGLRGPAAGSPVARAAAVAGPTALALQLWLWATVDDGTAGLFRGGLGAHGILSAVVILGVLVPGPLARGFSWRPLVAVGKVSYGVYLYHWPLFLWLTPARVGIDGIGLTVLRVAATGAVSALSFRFVEEPIRRGAPRHRHGPAHRPASTRPLQAGALAAALVVVALALPQTEAVDIAGADPDGRVEPDAAPTIGTGGPLQVAFVVDERSEGLVAEVESILDEEAGWAVAGLARLDCPPPAGSAACDWAEAWAALDRSDVDAVVVLTDAWDFRDALAAELPGAAPTSTEGVDWAAQRFVEGIDLLAGASARRVLWVGWPVDPAGGARQALADADWSMERRVTAARPALVHVELGAPATAELVRDAISLQATAGAGDARAVMVVGDSVAASMAAGLRAWGAENDVVVWDAARGGCGVVRDGRRVDLDGSFGSEDDCRPWRDEWASAAASWGADLVVVLVGVWDVSDRALPGDDEVRQPGDPAWDQYVLDEYGAMAADFEAAGIPVVVMAPPCMGYEGDRVPGGLGGGNPIFAGDRQRHLRDVVLPRLVAEHPSVRIHDLFADLCPDATFVEQAVGDQLVRPDGVHFGEAGAVDWAEQHAAGVLGP